MLGWIASAEALPPAPPRSAACGRLPPPPPLLAAGGTCPVTVPWEQSDVRGVHRHALRTVGLHLEGSLGVTPHVPSLCSRALSGKPSLAQRRGRGKPDPARCEPVSCFLF